MKQSCFGKATCIGRAATVLVLAAVVAGCGMSSITSGLSTGILGGSDDGGEVSAVTEEQLLSAAKSDTTGAGGTATAAYGCPRFKVHPSDRYYTRYEPGREGDGLGIIHRGEITRTARECQIERGRIFVKYGFSGRVLLGPLGKPGPVTLPVTVQVTDANRQTLQSDPVVIPVEVPPDKPMGYFSMVRTVTFEIPEGTRPADYTLYVAFDGAGQS